MVDGENFISPHSVSAFTRIFAQSQVHRLIAIASTLEEQYLPRKRLATQLHCIVRYNYNNESHPMKRSATQAEAITPAQYRAFQEAYDFFNAELFAGSLPHVLVTLKRP